MANDNEQPRAPLTAIERQAQHDEAERRITALSTVAWGDKGASITTMSDAWRFAKMVSDSGLYPGVDTPQKALVKAQTGAELGFSFNVSMQNVHLIEGRPVLGAHLMLAAVLRSKIGRYRFVEMTAKRCCIEWSRVVEDFDGKKEWVVVGQSEWTIEEAAQAELTGGKRAPWNKTPADMLRARAIGRGTRAFFPDILMGSITEDEARDVKEDVGDGRSTVPEADLRGNASVAAKLGASTATVSDTPPPPSTTKRASKKDTAPPAGEAPPASSTQTSPASSVAAPPAATQETTKPASVASAVSGTSSVSKPDDATGKASDEDSNERTAGGDDVVDATFEDVSTDPSPAAPISGATSVPPPTPSSETSTPASAPAPSEPTSNNEPASSPPASPTSTPTDAGELSDDELLQSSAPDQWPSALLVEAVKTLVPGPAKQMVAHCGSWKTRLTAEEYAVLHITAIAINNHNQKVAMDSGMDDTKRAALEKAMAIPGTPIPKV